MRSPYFPIKRTFSQHDSQWVSDLENAGHSQKLAFHMKKEFASLLPTGKNKLLPLVGHTILQEHEDLIIQSALDDLIMSMHNADTKLGFVPNRR